MTSRLIDIRTITTDGPTIHFKATDPEKKSISERFEIPELISLEVDGSFSLQDHIVFDGILKAKAKRTCVVILNLFTEETSTPLHLLFDEASNKETIEPDEDEILPIIKGKINLFDVFAEEYGLSLNPFPKSVSTYLDYHDTPIEKSEDNPFSVLKKLKK